MHGLALRGAFRTGLGETFGAGQVDEIKLAVDDALGGLVSRARLEVNGENAMGTVQWRWE